MAYLQKIPATVTRLILENTQKRFDIRSGSLHLTEGAFTLIKMIIIFITKNLFTIIFFATVLPAVC